MPQEFNVGGQAVIEGVMMRGRESWSVAVRTPQGEIEVRREPYKAFGEKHPWARLPLVRGSVALVESMAIGTKALFWAANKSAVEPDGSEAEIPKSAIAISMALGVLLFLVLFMMGPAAITRYVVDRFVSDPTLANLAEGLIRIAMLIGYMWGLSLMSDVRRMFQYHGAEHKTIAAYEYGDRLAPEAVERYSTRHVRCGTNFLFIVMVLAVLTYSFLGRPPLLWRMASRIVLIPVVAGVAYEVIRLAARHVRSRVVRVLMAPGLALQAITTRQPDREQLEVAIASLEAVLSEQESREAVERPILPEAVAIPA
ncbi:MAG: DUF1385 domain-containing protein [Acidobacteria bacterium]|nr:MAG: DUF1385 domain-containing protein [Acidobacteriota bacterium]